MHWETPTASSSSFPPFPFVPIAQAPSEKLLQTPIRNAASKATKRRKPLSFLHFCSSKLCDLIVLSNSPTPQLPCLPRKFSQSGPSIHHLPSMHTSPQLGFLPSCPRDHKGALHCGPTSAWMLVKKEGNAGASRDCISGITLLCGLFCGKSLSVLSSTLVP